MKSDSLFKKIAGVVIFSLAVNAGCRSIDAANKKEINNLDDKLTGIVLNSNSGIITKDLMSIVAALKTADTTIEEESDVSNNRACDSNTEEVLTTGTSTESGELEQNVEQEVPVETQAIVNETDSFGAAQQEVIIETSKYANIGVCTASDYVNIRAAANADSELVGKLYTDGTATIETLENGWYKITSGNVSGYIREDLLLTGLSDDELLSKYSKRYAVVTTTTLNVRREASETASKIKQISNGDKCEVVEDLGEWIKVTVDGSTGFVAKAYVSIEVEFKSAISIEEENAIIAAKAAEEARLQEEAAKKAEEQKRIEAEAVALASAAVESKNSESTTSSTESSLSASDEEIMYIACIIYTESGSESYEGKLGVANVVLNRYRSGSYPNTIKGVISQSGQFSPYRTGLFDSEVSKYLSGSYASDSRRRQCVEAAIDALGGNNNIGSRTHFNGANSTNSNYSNSIIIGSHAFW